MYRAQILLEEQQFQTLARLARLEGRSVSDLVREMLASELARREQSEEVRRQRRLAALDAIADDCREILERRGGRPMDFGDVLSELRDERDGDILEGFARGR